jgi:hypothetical protein
MKRRRREKRGGEEGNQGQDTVPKNPSTKSHLQCFYKCSMAHYEIMNGLAH